MLDFLKNILSDKQYVKRNAIIQIAVATVAFILLVRVYPMGVVQQHSVSKQQAYKQSEINNLSGADFTSNDKKLQTVYFSNSHLYQIKLYLNAEITDKSAGAQTILFRLYNDEFSCIYELQYSCRDIENDGYLKAVADIDVDTDKAYYYEIIVPEDSSAHIGLPLADRETLAQTENSILYIDGIINEEVSLIADFDYSQPLSAFGILIRYIIIVLAAAAVYILLMWLINLYDSRLREHKGKASKYLRIIVSAVCICFSLALMVFSVILNKFGVPVLDRGFYFVAIIVFSLWILGGVWVPYYYPKTQKNYNDITASKKIFLVWRNYIQTVSFGLLFYSLCQYVNADREYYHYVNTRWMLIFLAIAILMMLNENQFMNKISLIWLLGGWICSALYCRGFKGDEAQLLLARLTCGVYVAWGLLIISLLLQLRHTVKLKLLTDKPMKYIAVHKQQLVYVVLWLVFIAFMYAYRFEKVWVFTATLPFLALFFVRLTPASKSRLLKNFTNGIMVSFGLVTLFCLHHRPHHYWMLYRYGGMFHTVACTGMYLSVVFGAALGKLYGRLKDRKNIMSRCFFDFFLIGVAADFIILTMSRTAFLTVTVTVIMVASLAAYTYRKSIKRILYELGMLFGVIVISFPMVFTAVRMVPAVVNEPIRYELEFQDESFMIYKGDPIDSDKYMTVGRFFSALFGRFQSENESAGDDEASIAEMDNLLVYTGNNLSGVDAQVMAVNAGEDTGQAENEEANDISNGRFEIFSKYFKALRFGGHAKMGLESGEDYAHAHNSYLQVAYNFGIIAGVVFIGICVMSLWRAAKLVKTQGRKYGIYFVPFALIVVFGFVSLTEWAFHPCIPAGFCFLLLQVILIRE